MVLFLGLAISTSANVYIPKAKLAGETVFVHITKEAAVVTAVFEFDDWITLDAKVVYFPIFTNASDDPIQILAHADFALEVDGKKLGVAAPCETPTRFGKLPKNPRISWYAANLDELIDNAKAEVDFNRRIIVRLSYTQPLIHGRFYYLPVVIGSADPDKEKRSWNYQMLAHSNLKILQVLSKQVDYEQLGNGVVVYLKDTEIVVIQ